MFKNMKWTVLLISTLLNKCGGEITTHRAVISCWNKNNTLICDTAKDCSWNATAFPELVIGKNYECLVNRDSGTIHCNQVNQTCSSFKECGFSHNPLVHSCTISYEYSIRCFDGSKNQICSDPKNCYWNPQTFPNKTGDYKCENVSGDMQCSETSNPEDICSSNKDCGFTRSFANYVTCSMSYPGIKCLDHSGNLLCYTHEDCRWNPKKFPHRHGFHQCQYAHEEFKCRAKYGTYHRKYCNSYKDCGFHDELFHIDKCIISWLDAAPLDPGRPTVDSPTVDSTAAWAVPLSLLCLILPSVAIWYSCWEKERRQCATPCSCSSPATDTDSSLATVTFRTLATDTDSPLATDNDSPPATNTDSSPATPPADTQKTPDDQMPPLDPEHQRLLRADNQVPPLDPQ